MQVFIGYDPVEPVAYHVLAHSILSRARRPVPIAPIGNTVLPPIWTRRREPHDSTEFSNARFMVPWLAGYSGWACFMDCDMLCLTDIWDLFDLTAGQDEKAVLLRQHQHHPEYNRKFLGREQAHYARKNWSSLMLLNCGHTVCRGLTPEYVAKTPGLDLHGFKWCPDVFIGAIPAGWNTLIEHGPRPPHDKQVALAHFTQGGPWHGYLAQFYADTWGQELEAMIAGDNPRAFTARSYSPARATLGLSVEYQLDSGRPGDSQL